MPSDNDNADLPSLYREIAEVTDRETALIIAREVGGQRRFIAANPTPNGWLASAVGMEHALAISRALVTTLGAEFEFPMGPLIVQAKGRAADRLILTTAKSNNEIAREVGLHFKTVQRRRRRLREDDKI